MHLFVLGILLGWGAAVPIGPVNIEMTRRNLGLGTRFGIATGIGATSADLTYLVLLTVGAIVLLQHQTVLTIVGITGSLILAWFGWQSLRTKSKDFQLNPENNKSVVLHGMEGYLMTFFNPYTILFWASVSSQLSLAAQHQQHAVVYAGLGVISGTLSWMLTLNLTLHFTRHKLPAVFMSWLNKIGGIILLVFALLGIAHVVMA